MQSGCAHQPGRPKSSLSERVSMAWQSKVENKWGIVWEMASVDSQSKISRDEFLRRTNLDVLDFAIEKIEMASEEKFAKATIRFTTRKMGIKISNIQIAETWVLEEDEWRLVLMSHSQNPFEKRK